jgi:hypothetical protein
MGIGHTERAKHAILRFRHALALEITTEELRRELLSAPDIDTFWRALSRGALSSGFSGVVLHAENKTLQMGESELNTSLWRVRIPVGDDYVELLAGSARTGTLRIHSFLTAVQEALMFRQGAARATGTGFDKPVAFEKFARGAR